MVEEAFIFFSIAMESPKDWDVEKHKQEHECDEHWELRRKFLEAHKDRFPEDQLVCLAQVFTNVELLGCRWTVVFEQPRFIGADILFF